MSGLVLLLEGVEADHLPDTSSRESGFSLLIGLKHSSHCILTPIVGHRRCTHQDKDYYSAKAKREF
jgi:hypothetical protein